MKKVKISQVDALFSNGSYPIEFLFFYKKGISTKKIQRALKKLSSQFWPVFGEFKDGAIIFERYREEDFFAEETLSHELDISELEQKRQLCLKNCILKGHQQAQSLIPYSIITKPLHSVR